MPYASAETRRLYNIWNQMRLRCTDHNHDAYVIYGHRGITVCPRWLPGFDKYNLKKGFAAFCEDMSPHPGPGYSLDRKDNDEGYSKENCRWATKEEQNRNKRNNHIITYKGRTQTAVAWAQELFPENPGRIQTRLAKGWSVEDALGTPIRLKTAARRRGPLTHKGETLSVQEWATRLFPENPSILHVRLGRGWDPERALSTPAR
jgi:hypothetical protein